MTVDSFSAGKFLSALGGGLTVFVVSFIICRTNVKLPQSTEFFIKLFDTQLFLFFFLLNNVIRLIYVGSG